MRRWWRSFGRNRGAGPVEPAPLVSQLRPADLAGPVVVVAGEAVSRLTTAVLPGVETRHFPELRAAWAELTGTGLAGLPRLVVLAQDAASREELAVALAYLAPRTSVLLLHRLEELEDLGECYLRVVAEHPDETDVDAPVEVVYTPAIGREVARALRAAAPSDVTVADCPSELAGPLDPGPPDGPGGRRTPDSARPSGAAPAISGAASPAAPIVVVVVSAKGGAGKTTTAVALAATLAHAMPVRRVCLVDLDVRDGQLAALLDQQTPNAATLLADSGGITDATVLAHLVYDDRLGVSALLAPPDASDEAELLTGVPYRQIIGVLRRHFDVIVLDCPVTYREPLMAGMALVEADRIAVVTTLAVTSLAVLDRLLRTLGEPVTAGGLGVPRRKFGIVVNGALNGVAIDRAQVARRSHGLPLVAAVPHAARDMLIATNQHRLDLLLDHPDLAPAYRDLASWCLGAEQLAAAAPAHGPRQRPARVRRAAA